MTLFEKRKEALLNNLLKGIVILGGLAYIPSLIASLYFDLYLLAVIDTLAYLIVAIVFFLPQSRYEIRVTSMVFITLILGTAVLLETGTDGAGHIWLLFAVLIAALFGRRRMIILTIALTQTSMLLFALLSATGIAPQPGSLVSIAAIAANMLLISITLSLITFELLRQLKGEIDAQEGVLRLLHHRIKNNLQTVESLAGLEDNDSGNSRRLRRRLRAVAAANELLTDDHESETIPLAELLRVITRADTVHIIPEALVSVRIEKTVEIAVGMSDLFELLESSGPLTITVAEELEIRGTHPLPGLERADLSSADLLIKPSWISGDTRREPHTLTIKLDL